MTESKVNAWQKEVDGEKFKGEITKRQQDVITDDEYIHYLHCGGFMGVHTCQNF